MSHKSRVTLCWSCKHAVPNVHKKQGCEWSIRLQPVPGWTAKATKINNAPKGRYITSYRIFECPKFIKG